VSRTGASGAPTAVQPALERASSDGVVDGDVASIQLEDLATDQRLVKQARRGGRHVAPTDVLVELGRPEGDAPAAGVVGEQGRSQDEPVEVGAHEGDLRPLRRADGELLVGGQVVRSRQPRGTPTRA
jgi:hypothetical protein